MDKQAIIKKVEAGNFAENNGKILRTLNILEGDFVDLDVLKNVLTAVKSAEFFKSVVYLNKADYIEIRDKETKAKITAEQAKMVDAEAALTAAGIRIAMGYEVDPAVEI